MRFQAPDSADRLCVQTRNPRWGEDVRLALQNSMASCSLRFSDHRGENEDAFFASFNEAAKRVPCPKSGNIGSIRFLACDDHYGAEAVAVKLRHCSEVCGEHFTVPGLQCSDERIHGLFGCRNHKEIVGRCGGVAPAAPISASFWNQKEYIGCIPPQAGGWAEIPTRFISPHCRSPRRYCQMPWSRHT